MVQDNVTSYTPLFSVASISSIDPFVDCIVPAICTPLADIVSLLISTRNVTHASGELSSETVQEK